MVNEQQFKAEVLENEKACVVYFTSLPATERVEKELPLMVTLLQELRGAVQVVVYHMKPSHSLLQKHRIEGKLPALRFYSA